MNKRELTKYFKGAEGAQIASTKELIIALYDGEIHIEEQMNYPVTSEQKTYQEANDKVQ